MVENGLLLKLSAKEKTEKSSNISRDIPSTKKERGVMLGLVTIGHITTVTPPIGRDGFPKATATSRRQKRKC